MSEIKQNIQKNIAIFRKKANLTQKELASRIGVAPTNLASWEQGKSTPDIDTLFSLCSALQVNILNMYGLSDESKQAIQSINKLVLSSDEEKLVEDYRSFNDEGKEKIRDYITDLSDSPRYKKYSDISIEKHA